MPTVLQSTMWLSRGSRGGSSRLRGEAAESSSWIEFSGQFPAPWLGLVQIVPSHGADGWLSFEGVICDPAAPGLVRTLALGAGCKGSTLDWGVLVTEVVPVVGRGDSSSSEHAVENIAMAAMNTVAAIIRITL